MLIKSTLGVTAFSVVVTAPAAAFTPAMSSPASVYATMAAEGGEADDGKLAALCSTVGVNDRDCAQASIADDDLGDMRGGFGGIAFSVIFGGSIANTAADSSLPNGLEVAQSDNNRVAITGALGSFAGANGAFQLTNIEGDNNVVNQSLTINVAIINGAAPDALSSLTAALGGGG